MQNRYADFYIFFRVLIQMQLPDFFSAALHYGSVGIICITVFDAKPKP
jgi:hypothetical protein